MAEAWVFIPFAVKGLSGQLGVTDTPSHLRRQAEYHLPAFASFFSSLNLLFSPQMYGV